MKKSPPLELFRGLPTYLQAGILGQERVLPRLASTFVRGEMGLASPRRPRGSLLLVGPTGVGKTESVNLVSDYLFAPNRPIRFDMSEFQLQGSVEKLIGATKDDRGLLGAALANRSRGILLFDEIEKSHHLLWNLFLQVLEDGRITLATGETLDLTGLYCVFTSNIGSEETIHMENSPPASIERTVLMRVRSTFRPELLARMEVMVFGRLSYQTQRAICEGMVTAEIARLGGLGYALTTTPAAIELLVRLGYHRLLGARPMRREIERQLQEAIIAALSDGKAATGFLVPDSSEERLVLRPG